MLQRTIPYSQYVISVFGFLSLVICLAFGAQALAEAPKGSGNRYNKERFYASEISAARAFYDTGTLQRYGEKHWKKPVIIDVRSIPEYRAGHPRGAYNIPYPFVNQACDTVDECPACNPLGRFEDGACKDKAAPRTPITDQEFLDAVAAILPHKSKSVYLLCRTSGRSIDAAVKPTWRYLRRPLSGTAQIYRNDARTTGYTRQLVSEE
jgi:rhodanese-related sulfurtransferase